MTLALVGSQGCCAAMGGSKGLLVAALIWHITNYLILLLIDFSRGYYRSRVLFIFGFFPINLMFCLDFASVLMILGE